VTARPSEYRRHLGAVQSGFPVSVMILGGTAPTTARPARVTLVAMFGPLVASATVALDVVAALHRALRVRTRRPTGACNVACHGLGADRVHRRYRRCQTSTGSPWHGDHAGRRDAEEDFFVLYVRGHRYEVGSEPVRNIVFRPDPLEAWGSPDPSLAEAQRAAARHDERAGWACREEARRGTEKRGSGSCRAVAGDQGTPSV